MPNPTCPICQASQEAFNAWLKGDKVIIILMCVNGHWRNVEVPASRFISVTGLRNPATPLDPKPHWDGITDGVK